MTQETPPKPDTPCIAVCFIDPASQLCLGCGRTLAEIARWHQMERSERLSVMATLHQRMTGAGLPIPAPRKRRETGA